MNRQHFWWSMVLPKEGLLLVSSARWTIDDILRMQLLFLEISKAPIFVNFIISSYSCLKYNFQGFFEDLHIVSELNFSGVFEMQWELDRVSALKGSSGIPTKINRPLGFVKTNLRYPARVDSIDWSHYENRLLTIFGSDKSRVAVHALSRPEIVLLSNSFDLWIAWLTSVSSFIKLGQGG